MRCPVLLNFLIRLPDIMDRSVVQNHSHQHNPQTRTYRAVVENLLMEAFATADRAERACIANVLEIRACKANIKATLWALNQKKVA